MKISDIYQKMLEEKLSYREFAPTLTPAITPSGLYYHVKRYCKKNNLPLLQNKSGPKEKEAEFVEKV